MKPQLQNAALLGVAERTVWYKPPDRALADPLNFVAHVLTYVDQDDVRTLRQYLDSDDIGEGARPRATWGVGCTFMVILE